MGVQEGISHDQFPKQGAFLHRRVDVCFNYDPTKRVGGRVVRDDAEEPGRMIIALDDGRFVLSTECMYSPAAEDPVQFPTRVTFRDRVLGEDVRIELTTESTSITSEDRTDLFALFDVILERVRASRTKTDG